MKGKFYGLLAITVVVVLAFSRLGCAGKIENARRQQYTQWCAAQPKPVLKVEPVPTATSDGTVVLTAESDTLLVAYLDNQFLDYELTSGEPVRLRDITDGEHILRVVASRSYAAPAGLESFGPCVQTVSWEQDFLVDTRPPSLLSVQLQPDPQDPKFFVVKGRAVDGPPESPFRAKIVGLTEYPETDVTPGAGGYFVLRLAYSRLQMPDVLVYAVDRTGNRTESAPLLVPLPPSYWVAVHRDTREFKQVRTEPDFTPEYPWWLPWGLGSTEWRHYEDGEEVSADRVFTPKWIQQIAIVLMAILALMPVFFGAFWFLRPVRRVNHALNLAANELEQRVSALPPPEGGEI